MTRRARKKALVSPSYAKACGLVMIAAGRIIREQMDAARAAAERRAA